MYNVPYDYRATYYDTPNAWYRYNNGYIYQVDPVDAAGHGDRRFAPDLRQRSTEMARRELNPCRAISYPE